jgi:hypothetical protein
MRWPIFYQNGLAAHLMVSDRACLMTFEWQQRYRLMATLAQPATSVHRPTRRHPQRADGCDLSGGYVL